MLETIIAQPLGIVTITSIEGDSSRVLLEKKNTILPNHKNVLAAILSGDLSARLDTMEVYLGPTLLASENSVTATVNVTTTEHTVTFGPPAFNGNYDKLVLKSSGYGEFSELLISPALTKAPTEQIQILWKINFN